MDYKALIIALASSSGPLSGADDFTKNTSKVFSEIIESNELFTDGDTPCDSGNS